MAQYLLSVHMVEGAPVPEPAVMERMFAQVDALNSDMMSAGIWVFAGGLQQPDAATVVRAVDGEIVMTDGPFAESREHLGGFWVIRVPDFDTALAWAKKATRACEGPVEVRPFQDEPEA